MATAVAVKADVQAVEQFAATVQAEFGGVSAILRDHNRLEALAGKTEAGLRAWYPVALAAREAGISAREFAKISGGSKDTMGRLIRGALLTKAFEQGGKRTVPAIMVQSVANRTTEEAMPALLADAKSGKTDLPTAKVRAIGPASPAPSREGAPNATTGADIPTVKPSQYADVLNVMTANVSKVAKGSRADVLVAAQALVKALEDASKG